MSVLQTCWLIHALHKGIVIQSNLNVLHEVKVEFDAELAKYGVVKGVITNPPEGEVFAPVAMWLEAVDILLDRLRQDGLDCSRIKAISGAGMQHGTVFWSLHAEELLKSLDPDRTLKQQLTSEARGVQSGAFSHQWSPNWQDASTSKECQEFDEYLGSPEILAEVTGSKAHHVWQRCAADV
jgi:xylulokinase